LACDFHDWWLNLFLLLFDIHIHRLRTVCGHLGLRRLNGDRWRFLFLPVYPFNVISNLPIAFLLLSDLPRNELLVFSVEMSD